MHAMPNLVAATMKSVSNLTDTGVVPRLIDLVDEGWSAGTWVKHETDGPTGAVPSLEKEVSSCQPRVENGDHRTILPERTRPKQKAKLMKKIQEAYNLSRWSLWWRRIKRGKGQTGVC